MDERYFKGVNGKGLNVQKQLLLRPYLIFTTSIELIPILMRMLDVQCAQREIDKILSPEQFASKVTQGKILGVALN
jgi:hypothetical protein